MKLTPVSPEELQRLLLLVSDHEVPIERCSRLSTFERALVADWAGATHMGASDNIVRKNRLERPLALLRTLGIVYYDDVDAIGNEPPASHRHFAGSAKTDRGLLEEAIDLAATVHRERAEDGEERILAEFVAADTQNALHDFFARLAQLQLRLAMIGALCDRADVDADGRAASVSTAILREALALDDVNISATDDIIEHALIAYVAAVHPNTEGGTHEDALRAAVNVALRLGAHECPF